MGAFSASAPATTEPYVSLADAANHFAVSSKTLRRYIADRKIPARRLGNRILVRLSEIEATLTPMGSAS